MGRKSAKELRNLLVESEKQLATAQREIIALSIKHCPPREDDRLMLKTEHASLFQKREDELLADVKMQLCKGNAEMKKQTAKAVETAIVRLNADIARVE